MKSQRRSSSISLPAKTLTELLMIRSRPPSPPYILDHFILFLISISQLSAKYSSDEKRTYFVPCFPAHLVA